MHRVYEALVQAGSAYKLPSPWHHIPCDPSFFCLPDDKAALFADLQRQFSDDDLIQAGVATMDAAKTVVLHPQLVVDGAPIWAIRDGSNQKPRALIAELQTVGKSGWAAAWAFQDYRQCQLLAAADEQVVVAYSMTDAAILRSIGFAAIPGGSWKRLTKPQLDLLCRKLRISSEAPPPHVLDAAWKGQAKVGPAKPGPVDTGRVESGPLSLLLANWSLAAFDATDIGAATTSWSHLRKLYRHLDLAFDTFGLWKPRAKHLKQLDYQLQYQSLKQVRAALSNNMTEDATAIDAELRVQRPPAQTINEAFRAWQLAERNGMNPVGRQQAYDRLCELIDQQRFDPLVNEALQASNLLERNAELALAEASRLLQPQVLLLTEKIRRSIAEKGTKAGSIVPQEELKQVLALFDRLLALTNGVLACRQNNSTKTAKSLKPTTVRSAPSASPPKKSPR